jgi:hypothetical protein
LTRRAELASRLASGPGGDRPILTETISEPIARELVWLIDSRLQ